MDTQSALKMITKTKYAAYMTLQQSIQKAWQNKFAQQKYQVVKKVLIIYTFSYHGVSWLSTYITWFIFHANRSAWCNQV